VILAVEPRREVADWLRVRARRIGVQVEVLHEADPARERLESGDVRFLAGYFSKINGLSRLSAKAGCALVPFVAGADTTEDHCSRWSLFLRAARERLGASAGREGASGHWVDPETAEEMENRHRGLLRDLDPVFVELARRDPSCREHSFRVGLYAARIGEALGLAPVEIRLLHLGGWVHDVGKIRIRTQLLRKGGPLGSGERAEMAAHTVWGARIVEALPADPEIVGMVRHHHERFDGKGYPAGLSGMDVPLLARILAVADAYDAVTSDRPYRSAAGHRHAVREILAGSGSQFDPAVVQAFLTARLDRLWVDVSAA
jgi:putative nucleotidyltransferase with HDIG domain